MPIRIPTYLSKTAPGVVDRGGTSPASTGLPVARGLLSVAGALAEIDLEVEKKMGDVARAQEVSSRTLEAQKRVADLNEVLEAKPDWQTHDSNWVKEFKGIKGEILGGINDPVVKNVMVSQMAEIEAKGYLHARQRRRQLFVDSSKANLVNTLKDAMEGAAQVENPMALIGLGVGTIRSAVAGGIITAEEGAKSENDFLEGVLVGFAKKDILADPATYFRKRKEGDYSQIGIGKVDLLDTQAVRQVEHNNRMAEQQVKKAQERETAAVLAGVESGDIDDAALDDLFLGLTRDPSFTPRITPDGYKEGKVKLAARRREGGFKNPGMTNSYKVELSLNPNRYSDQEIVGLASKGLNPGDVLELLEYKRGRVEDLQKLPPGASTGLSLIQSAVPRGFMNTMTDKVRAKLIEAEQEFISRVRKNPEKWESIASEISNRWKAVKNPQGTGMDDFKRALGEAAK